MEGWLYLIRNRDLYKIGITKNIDKRMRQLKPDNIEARIYTKDFRSLEKELHRRYKDFRIPQTEYFRLDDCHLKEINQRLSKLDYARSLNFVIFTKSLILTIVLFLLIFLFFFLNINDINIVILKSFFWVEKILFGYSFLSFFFNSNRYLSRSGNVKYKFSRFIAFMTFAFSFRIASILLQ